MDHILTTVQNQRGLRVHLYLNKQLVFGDVRQVEIEKARLHQWLDGKKAKVDKVTLQPEATFECDLRAVLITYKLRLEVHLVQFHPAELLVRRTG